MGLFSKLKRKAAAPAETEKKSVGSDAVVPESRGDVRGPAEPRATGDAFRVLVRPIVTEKSSRLSKDGTYVFEVSSGANKLSVKQAVKAVYHVEPEEVRVLRVLGKPVRTRAGYGRRKSWKKAIVTLKKGQTIDVFASNA
jgi:large subunit ribosomal protein L23